MRLQPNFVLLASIACAALVSAATISSAVTDIFADATSALSDSTPVQRRGYFLLNFSGTGTSAEDRDASVHGEGYMTFKYLNDKSYDVASCLDFCASVQDCVFVNVFYEYNISLEGGATNLKCALYNQTNPRSTKNNWGGQQQLAKPAELTYVRFSSGWTALNVYTYAGHGANAPESPVEVPGFKLAFDLDDGYVDAPGLLAYILMEDYDTQACADLCDLGPQDPVNGECKYFNTVTYESKDLSRAVHYCFLYAIPANESYLAFLRPESLFHLKDSRAYIRA